MSQLALAIEAKEDALDLLERTRKEYIAQARDTALAIARFKPGPITVNDVRKLCPPPDEIDPRVLGAVFRTGKNSMWKPVGYVRSERAHARPIMQFQLKDEYLYA